MDTKNLHSNAIGQKENPFRTIAFALHICFRDRIVSQVDPFRSKPGHSLQAKDSSIAQADKVLICLQVSNEKDSGWFGYIEG